MEKTKDSFGHVNSIMRRFQCKSFTLSDKTSCKSVVNTSNHDLDKYAAVYNLHAYRYREMNVHID